MHVTENVCRLSTLQKIGIDYFTENKAEYTFLCNMHQTVTYCGNAM